MLATQDLLELEGLPQTTGRDLGVLWGSDGNQKAELDTAERPIYPV